MQSVPEVHFIRQPTLVVLAQQQLLRSGVAEMADWVATRAPACLPEQLVGEVQSPEGLRPGILPHLTNADVAQALFPHGMRREDEVAALTDNELLVELAGRACYNSFGLKAGRKSNREYIEHTQQGDVPHRSILYHAKMTFFFAGISRRVSHELIRNYVGADRTEEGAPSQQSTRYVANPGYYVVPPRYLEMANAGKPRMLELFEEAMRDNFEQYRTALAIEQILEHRGMQQKRRLEAASGVLSHSVETSFLWTTNPEALAKLCRERDHEAADMEFRRFARKLKQLAVNHWPNLFAQPWMHDYPEFEAVE